MSLRQSFTVYNIQDSGAVGDGNNDDAAAVTTILGTLSVSGALLTGGTILIPSGSWTWKSVPVLPTGITNPIRILLERGAKVTLTTNGPQMFQSSRSADYQTFQNVTISGYGATIDANNIVNSGAANAAAGAYIIGHPNTNRMNISNIRIEGITGINGYTDTGGTNIRNWVNLSSSLSGSESQIVSVTNIVVKDLNLTGGLSGVTVAPFGTQANLNAKSWADNIFVEGIYWDSGTTPTASISSAGVQVAGKGHGGFATVKNCVIKRAWDAGIEAGDAFINTVVEDCTAEDCYNSSFYFNNFSPVTQDDLTTAAQQTVTVKNCRALYRNTYPHVGGFTMQADGTNNNTAGLVKYENCTTEIRGQTLVTGTSYAGWAHGSIGQWTQAVLENCAYVFDGYTYNSASNISPIGINYLPTNAAEVVVRNFRVDIAGTHGGSSGQLQVRGIALGGNLDFLIDGVMWDYNVTGTVNDSSFIAGIGGTSSSSMRGTIKRLWPRTDTGRATVRYIRFGDSTVMTVKGFILVSDCNFQDIASVSNTTAITMGGAADMKKWINFERIKWSTYPVASSSITVTASPFSYQNLDGYSEKVIVQGGTVSKIEYSLDNSTFTDIGIVAGSVLVDNGDYLRVTYSSTPTMTKIPVR